MKRYIGNLVIELEDQNTGVVETISETNMVTNAVNDILGVNPMGIMYKAGGEYDDSLTWNDELLPICPNMIGGILLFPDSIAEQADNLYRETEMFMSTAAFSEEFVHDPLHQTRWKSFLKKKKAMVQISLEDVISGVRMFTAPQLNIDSGVRSRWNPESRMWEK